MCITRWEALVPHVARASVCEREGGVGSAVVVGAVTGVEVGDYEIDVSEGRHDDGES